MSKKKHILIHPDHIEDLDAKWEKLKLNKKEPERTGYTTDCRVRNYTGLPGALRRLDILFHRSFVEEKMPSRCFVLYRDIKKDWLMMMPVPVKWMERSHVQFVERRWLSPLVRYGCKAELTTTPPSQLFWHCGISPLAESYRFRLEEWKVRDEYEEGDKLAYRLIPLSRF
jgi:hypothetical protein